MPDCAPTPGPDGPRRPRAAPGGQSAGRITADLHPGRRPRVHACGVTVTAARVVTNREQGLSTDRPRPRARLRTWTPTHPPRGRERSHTVTEPLVPPPRREEVIPTSTRTPRDPRPPRNATTRRLRRERYRRQQTRL